MSVLPLAAACLGLLLPAQARAGSLGGDFTTGDGYRGFDVKASAEFDPEGRWRGNATYSHAHSTVGSETLSNQAVLGFSHTADDVWDFRGSLTGWKDSISGVKYIGPSLGFTYSRYREGAEPSGSGERDPADQTLNVLLDSDLFFYQTGISASTATVRFVTIGRSRVPIIASAFSGKLNMVQFHPTLEIDKPLFGGNFIPFISAGHYFYSKDPTIIENAVGSLRFASSSGSLGAMVGGFFNNNGQVGFDLFLPLRFRLHALLGLEQQASDNTWSTTQGAALYWIFKRVKANAGWTGSIQDGVRQDLYTVGAAWIF